MNEKLFSSQAGEYAKYRPVYPKQLFEFISGLCNDHHRVWDSGTGNGQAAYFLANHFEKIYATDISLSQIENAFYHPKIEYKVEAAEDCSLPDDSIDAATSATAFHWFDSKKYYYQINRTLKHGGIFAIWSYSNCHISPEVDEVVKQYHQMIKPYWDNRIQSNLTQYCLQSFPYPLIEHPDFFMEKEYTLNDFIQYLFTWSPTQAYIKKHNKNPLDLIRSKLQNAFKGDFKKKAVWKIFMKIGRKSYIK